MAILTRTRAPKAGSDTQTVEVGPIQPMLRPSVNLLPPAALERAHARVVLRRFLMAGGGVLALCGVVWIAQTAQIASANNAYDDAMAAQDQARAELVPLEPVRQFAASLDRQKQAVGTAMADHTSFSRTLDSVARAVPGGSSVRSMEIALGEPCPGNDPFTPAPAIGCVKWGLVVPGPAEARSAAAAMETIPGLVNPYLTIMDKTETAYDVDGTVNIDERLHTLRYEPLLKGAAK